MWTEDKDDVMSNGFRSRHREVDGFQVDWDGATVWVNDPSGQCVGRFSRTAYEVHAPETGQDGFGPKLDAVQPAPDLAGWDAFAERVRSLHGVVLPAESRPQFLVERGGDQNRV